MRGIDYITLSRSGQEEGEGGDEDIDHKEVKRQCRREEVKTMRRQGVQDIDHEVKTMRGQGGEDIDNREQHFDVLLIPTPLAIDCAPLSSSSYLLV